MSKTLQYVSKEPHSPQYMSRNSPICCNTTRQKSPICRQNLLPFHMPGADNIAKQDFKRALI